MVVPFTKTNIRFRIKFFLTKILNVFVKTKTLTKILKTDFKILSSASNFKILSSENVINHGTSLQVRVDNMTNMQLHEYLSSAFEGDMLGYLRNETWPMHLFLQQNMSILKLQLHLSSFLHMILYFSLQHWHILFEKNVHRTSLVARISLHVIFSTLSCSDGPW